MSELLLKNLNKHVTLTDDEQDIVLPLFKPRRFKKHQFILQEGDDSKYETFVTKGLTRTYEIDEKGQEHIVQFGPEDWWVGDLYSFLTSAPSRYNIDCLEETEVLQISRSNLEQLYQQVPKIERHFRIMVQNAYIASIQRISSNMMKSAAERYREFIEKYPHISQRVPNHHIASFLGITPQSLSRIRSSKS